MAATLRLLLVIVLFLRSVQEEAEFSSIDVRQRPQRPLVVRFNRPAGCYWFWIKSRGTNHWERYSCSNSSFVPWYLPQQHIFSWFKVPEPYCLDSDGTVIASIRPLSKNTIAAKVFLGSSSTLQNPLHSADSDDGCPRILPFLPPHISAPEPTFQGGSLSCMPGTRLVSGLLLAWCTKQLHWVFPEPPACVPFLSIATPRRSNNSIGLVAWTAAVHGADTDFDPVVAGSANVRAAVRVEWTLTQTVRRADTGALWGIYNHTQAASRTLIRGSWSTTAPLPMDPMALAHSLLPSVVPPSEASSAAPPSLFHRVVLEERVRKNGQLLSSSLPVYIVSPGMVLPWQALTLPKDFPVRSNSPFSYTYLKDGYSSDDCVALNVAVLAAGDYRLWMRVRKIHNTPILAQVFAPADEGGLPRLKELLVPADAKGRHYVWLSGDVMTLAAGMHALQIQLTRNAALTHAVLRPASANTDPQPDQALVRNKVSCAASESGGLCGVNTTSFNLNGCSVDCTKHGGSIRRQLQCVFGQWLSPTRLCRSKTVSSPLTFSPRRWFNHHEGRFQLNTGSMPHWGMDMRGLTHVVVDPHVRARLFVPVSMCAAHLVLLSDVPARRQPPTDWASVSLVAGRPATQYAGAQEELFSLVMRASLEIDLFDASLQHSVLSLFTAQGSTDVHKTKVYVGRSEKFETWRSSNTWNRLSKDLHVDSSGRPFLPASSTAKAASVSLEAPEVTKRDLNWFVRIQSTGTGSACLTSGHCAGQLVQTHLVATTAPKSDYMQQTSINLQPGVRLLDYAFSTSEKIPSKEADPNAFGAFCPLMLPRHAVAAGGACASSSPFLPGSRTCTFACMPGFDLRGSNTLRCVRHGFSLSTLHLRWVGGGSCIPVVTMRSRNATHVAVSIPKAPSAGGYLLQLILGRRTRRNAFVTRLLALPTRPAVVASTQATLLLGGQVLLPKAATLQLPLSSLPGRNTVGGGGTVRLVVTVLDEHMRPTTQSSDPVALTGAAFLGRRVPAAAAVHLGPALSLVPPYSLGRVDSGHTVPQPMHQRGSGVGEVLFYLEAAANQSGAHTLWLLLESDSRCILSVSMHSSLSSVPPVWSPWTPYRTGWHAFETSIAVRPSSVIPVRLRVNTVDCTFSEIALLPTGDGYNSTAPEVPASVASMPLQAYPHCNASLLLPRMFAVVPPYCHAVHLLSTKPCVLQCLPGYANARPPQLRCDSMGQWVLVQRGADCFPTVRVVATGGAVYAWWPPVSVAVTDRPLFVLRAALVGTVFHGDARHSQLLAAGLRLRESFTFVLTASHRGSSASRQFIASTPSGITRPGAARPPELVSSTGGALVLALHPPEDSGGVTAFDADGGSYQVYLLRPAAYGTVEAAVAAADAASRVPISLLEQHTAGNKSSSTPVGGVGVPWGNFTWAPTAMALAFHGPGPHGVVTNLTALTRYVVRVSTTLPQAVACMTAEEDGVDRLSPPLVFSSGPPSPPLQPDQPVLASVSAGAALLRLRWPDDYGGVPVTHYTLYVSAADALTLELQPPPPRLLWSLSHMPEEGWRFTVPAVAWETPVLLPHLRASQGYHVAFTVTTAQGTSPRSSAVTLRTQAARVPALVTLVLDSVQSPPSLLGHVQPPPRSTLSAGNRSLPALTGGAVRLLVDVPDSGGVATSVAVHAILGGTSSAANDGAAAWTEVAVTQERVVWVGPFPSDTAVHLSAVATNVLGAGPRSDVLTLTTLPPSTPGPPLSLEVVAAGAGMIRLAWRQADGGGLPLLPSHVMAAASSANPFPVLLAAVTQPEAAIGGLLAHTRYTLLVCANNALGRGPCSTVSATTPPPTPPTAVQRIRRSEFTATSITMEWDPPVDTGGLPLTYSVLSVPALTPLPLAQPASLLARHEGLARGASYTYRIVASNAVGAGPSTSVTLDTAAQLQPPSVPGQPRVLRRSHTSLTAAWAVSRSDGGSPITAYSLCYAKARSLVATHTCASASCCEHSLSGLQADTAYVVTLTATNAQGDSPATLDATLRTQPEPGVPPTPIVHCVSPFALLVSWTAPVAKPPEVVVGYKLTSAGQSPPLFDFRRGGTNAATAPPLRVVVPVQPGATYALTLTTYALPTPRAEAPTVGASSSPPVLTVTPAAAAAAAAPASGGGRFVCSTTAQTTIQALQYEPSQRREWHLVPPLRTGERLLLRFTQFHLECDYDRVAVTRPASRAEAAAGHLPAVVVWSGGCARAPFSLSVPANATVVFTSDGDVQRTGFSLTYAVEGGAAADDAAAEQPQVCPGGAASRLQPGTGRCGCARPSAVRAGESCSGFAPCPAASATAALLCARPSSVLTVMPSAAAGGSGTLDPSPGMPGKPLSSLTDAVARAVTAGAEPPTLLLLPGVYSGPSQLPVTVSFPTAPVSLSLTSLRGRVPWGVSYASNGQPLSDGDGDEAVLDCAGLGRAVELQSRTVRVTLQLTGLLLRNCNASSAAPPGGGSGSGSGGSYSSSRSSNCATASHGGAVCIGGAAVVLRLINCRVEHSVSVGDGGGIAVFGGAQLELRDSTISHNTAYVTSGHIAADVSCGGAVSTHDSPLQLLGSTVLAGNRAPIGGGLCVRSTATAATGVPSTSLPSRVLCDASVELRGNRASVAGGNLAVRGAAWLNQCTASHGRAAIGGGAHIVLRPHSSCVLCGARLHSNHATVMGGGVSVVGGGTLLLLGGTTIQGNTAAQGGGGLLLEAGSRCRGSSNATITGNSSPFGLGGGAFSILSAHAKSRMVRARRIGALVTSLRDPVAAVELAAVSSAAVATARLSSIVNISLHHNSASHGGGLAVHGCQLSLIRCAVVENGAALQLATPLSSDEPASSGGGVHVSGEGTTLTLRSTRIATNTADVGGGVALVGVVSLTADGPRSPLTGNTASHHGGNLAVERSSLRVANVTTDVCTITNVTAVGGLATNGGGLAVLVRSTLHVSALTLTGNRATSDGGGVLLMAGASVTATASTIRLNSASGTGGGVALRNLSSFTSRHPSQVVLRGNVASSGGGLALHRHVSRVSGISVEHCSASVGGGLLVTGAAPRHPIANLVLRANLASHCGGGLAVVLLSRFGEPLIVSGLTISGNTAVVCGGGLHADVATVLLSAVTLTGNTAPQGGNVHAHSSSFLCSHQQLVISANLAGSGVAAADAQGGNMFVSGNSSLACAVLQAGSAVKGAGLWVAPFAVLRLTDVTISNNTARAAVSVLSAPSGGGLYIGTGASVTAIRLRVTGNTANSGSGGGAFMAPTSTLHFRDADVTHNTAGAGAGIAVASASLLPVAASSRTHLLVSGNHAATNGGGLLLSGAGVICEAILVTHNSADSGGGVASQGATGALRRLLLHNNSAAQGGALLILSAASAAPAACSGTTGPSIADGPKTGTTLQVVDCELLQNQATRGAGMYLSLGARGHLTGCNVQNNTATGNGGGAHLSQRAVLVLTDCTVARNGAVKYGGGVYLSAASRLIARGQACRLLFNRARYGGAIASVDSSADLRSCDLQGNSAINGAGLRIDSESRFELRRCLLRQNVAKGSGGALSVGRESSVALRDSTLSRNTAGSGGAIIVGDDGSLDAVGCRFTHNAATQGGGAVMVADVCTVHLRHTSVEHNQAGTSGGGGTATGAATLVVEQCIFEGNVASIDGGGLFSDLESSVTLQSTTFRRNLASRGRGGAVFTTRTLISSLVISNITAHGNSAAEGGGIHWMLGKQRFPPLQCVSCSLNGNSPTDLSTDPSVVAFGWVPTKPIMSGVVATSSGGPSSSAPVYMHVRIQDFYAQVNLLVSDVRCFARVKGAATPGGGSAVLDGTEVQAVKGIATFSKFSIRGDAGSIVEVQVTCSGYESTPLSVAITVAPCFPAHELNSARRCVRCKPGKYSPHGSSCWPCPARKSSADATCVQPLLLGAGNEEIAVSVGTELPATMPGRALFAAQSIEFELLSAALSPAVVRGCARRNQESGAVSLPHLQFNPMERADWRVALEDLPSSMQHTCVTGMQVYSCPLGIASCPGNVTNRSVWQCGPGYTGALCAACDIGFYKDSSALCASCGVGGSTSRELSMTYYTVKLFALVLSGVVVLFLLLRLPGHTPELRSHAALLAAHSSALRMQTFLRGAKTARMRGILHRGQKVFALYHKAHHLLFVMVCDLRVVRPEKFKIMLAFAQVFSNLKGLYPLAWPPSVVEYMREFSVSNMDFVRITGVQCLARVDFFTSFTTTFLAPICMFALLASVAVTRRHQFNKYLHCHRPGCLGCGTPTKYVPSHMVWQFVSLHVYSSSHPSCNPARPLSPEARHNTMMRNLRAWRRRMLIRMKSRDYDNKCWQLLFWVLLLVYPVASVNVLKIFHCVQVGNEFFLAVDFQVNCYTERWSAFSGLGVVGVVLYILGIPLLFFVVLKRARDEGVGSLWAMISSHDATRREWLHRAMEDDLRLGRGHVAPSNKDEEKTTLCAYLRRRNMRSYKTTTRLGFVYDSYQEHRWWYELFELLRKLTMNGAILFVHTSNAAGRLSVGTFVCLLALVVCQAASPYERRTDAWVAVLALAQLTLTFFLGVMLQLDVGLFSANPVVDARMVSFFIVASNILVLISAVVCFGLELRNGLRLAQAEHHSRALRSQWSKARALASVVPIESVAGCDSQPVTDTHHPGAAPSRSHPPSAETIPKPSHQTAVPSLPPSPGLASVPSAGTGIAARRTLVSTVVMSHRAASRSKARRVPKKHKRRRSPHSLKHRHGSSQHCIEGTG